MARACFEACWLGELSQHSVAPHCWHVRRWTHCAPIFTHSAHSRRLACRTVVIAARWVQLASGIGDLSCSWRGGDAPKVPARCYLIMLSSQGFGECLLRCPSNV